MDLMVERNTFLVPTMSTHQALADEGVEEGILRGLYKLRGGPVFQRAAQGVETGLILRRFGEVEGAGEILGRERLCAVARLRAKGQRRLVFGGGRCGRGILLKRQKFVLKVLGR